MYRLLLCLCFCLFAGVCFADKANGVIAEERIVKLPEDGGKCFISVVGDPKDARYRQVLKWFDTDPQLKKLKDTVHFNPVATGTAIYVDRYASNTKTLPMVRLQNSDGVVYAEVAGKDLPMTPQALSVALSNKVVSTECVLLKRLRDRRKCPEPDPLPAPIDDPEPQPIDDTPDQVVEQAPIDWLLLPLCAVGFAVGVAAGYWKKLKEQLSK